MTRKLTQSEFEAKVFEVHGDRYDLSKAMYVKSREKVTVLCKVHGEILITPNSLISGNGCRKCADLLIGKESKAKIAKEFKCRLESVFGDTYDLDGVYYSGYNTPVKLTCKRHGVFEKNAVSLLKGIGCRKCSDEYYQKKRQEERGTVFLQKMSEMYPNGCYDFSKSVFTTTSKKVVVDCAQHGEFLITPESLLQGSGCTQCGVETVSKIRSERAFSTLIERYKEIHGEDYDYSKVVYLGSEEDIEIICNTCGNTFWQNVGTHRSSGCHCRTTYGFKQNKPAILYYLRVETRNQIAYKVGITNRTVKDRYSVTDLSKITVLSELSFQQGADAYKEEQAILKEYSEYRCVGDPLLENGNSELFTKDILNKDNYEGF